MSTDPARRIELTADAFATSQLAAAIVADWRLSQLRRLLPVDIKLALIPLPGPGPTPTWGGTGAGIPLYNANPQHGHALLQRLLNPVVQKDRFAADGIVPASASAREFLTGPDAAVWQAVSRGIASPTLTGEETAAVQRELNRVLRIAMSPTLSHTEQIRDALRQADARLCDAFPTWGQP